MACYSQQPAHFRDVGRASLQGIEAPRLTINLDNPSGIVVSPRDIGSQGGVLICGRVTIYPSTTVWYDGTELELSSLNLSIQSSDGRFKDSASSDPSAPRNPSTGIKFGTRAQMSGKAEDIAVWSFMIRVPAAFFAAGSIRSAFAVRISAGLGQDRQCLPASVLAPTGMQIHAKPVMVEVAVKERIPAAYPLSPPSSPQ